MVKVGAATETEMKEKKHRVEDALQATRAALEEGIVPGGGVALMLAAKAIDVTGDDDESTGARIIKRALEEPLRQLATNAGLEASVVVNEVRNAKKGWGLNVDSGETVDLVKAGIIDPRHGHALGAAERGLDRQEHPHHRGRRGRGAGEAGRRWRRRCPVACPT